ncbi:hypothetical protein ABGF49_06270 [Helcococcus ovis]|uniref:hypothetical protein n=1 Tax=Helcococcus TaxID=31983 RepID=UPI0038B88B7E
MENRNIKYKKEKKTVNRLLIITALIIFIASLEAFNLGKNQDLLKVFLELNKNNSPSDYMEIIITNYFYNIFEVILITLFTFFTYKKYGISKLFKIIFSLIILIKTINIIISFKTNSIFYYLIVLLYICYLLVIIKAPITKRKVNYGLFKNH